MKDEAHRDNAIAKLVSDKLRAQSSAPTAACPEVEILAAYIERTLAPKERSRWEEHFAACARCQQTIAEIVRLSEAEEPVMTPAVRPARPRGIFGLRWAWAAPMLVALVVAGLWYTGEFKEQVKQTPSSGERISVPAQTVPAKPEGTEKAEKNEAAAPPAKQTKTLKNIPEKSEPLTKPAASAPAAANVLAREKPSEAKGTVASGGEVSPPTEETAGAASHVTSRPEAKFKTVPRGAADQLAEQSQGAMVTLQERSAQTAAPRRDLGVESKESSAKAQPMTALSENAGGGRAAQTYHYARQAPEGERSVIKKPPVGLWRVGAHGLIEKADSSGKWVTQESGVTEDLLAVSSLRPEVGWIVGQAGTILRTIDGGKTWEKLGSPTGEDLVRVTATGARSAEISTRSGLAYSTTDGGKTWRAISRTP